MTSAQHDPVAHIGSPRTVLQSTLITGHEPVFTDCWFSAAVIPRFDQENWDIAGADPMPSRTVWSIRFTGLTPQWSLIAREVLFWRANLRRMRHLAIAPTYGKGHNSFRASTIGHWHTGLTQLAAIADELDIGLPHTWTTAATDRLRDHIRTETPTVLLGQLVQTLYHLREVLTLGGLQHDPTRDEGHRRWAGDNAVARSLRTQAIPPHVFRAVVGNALTYIERCAPDILAALHWRERYLAQPHRSPGDSLPDNHPVRAQHPDVIGQRLLDLHHAIERIGGIPVVTVARFGRNRTEGDYRDVCMATLAAAANRRIHHQGTLDRQFVLGRLAAGTPKVFGGLPIPISVITRADGSTGPWRDSLCWQSIAVEAETLTQACQIVVAAFTAMRDGEIARIPATGWRTTWAGADAITAPLIKNAYGEPMKWWATPPVLRACELLERLTDPSAEFLVSWAGRFQQLPADERIILHAGVSASLQKFVSRMSTGPHLHGFVPIAAGWHQVGSNRRMTPNLSLPTINARQFRFTLASISNFVALGDAAFQQQAKHAKITMSHSYQANGGTDAWTDTILNTLANDDAQHRTAETVDLFIGIWTGDNHLAGHAGRDLTRTVRDLLDSLPVADYDPAINTPVVEQFMTQVMSIPELAAAIKSTAQILYPGTIAHCLRYAQHMECTDKSEPVQGLCHPQTCRNVLLEPAQQVLINKRLNTIEGWLGIPGINTAQRTAFEQSARQLRAQLRTIGD